MMQNRNTWASTALVLALLLLVVSIGHSQGRWEIIDDQTLPHRATYIYSLGAFLDGPNTVLAYHLRYSTKEAYVRLSTDAGESWRTIREDLPILPTGELPTFPPRMHSIQIPSSNLILLAGDSGNIWRTDDQGESWQTIRLGRIVSRIPILQMVDESFGFAMQFDTIWRTYDGGGTWEAEWIDTSEFDGYYPIGAKVFTRERWIWWAVIPGTAIPMAILTTTDGGNTWRKEVDTNGKIAYREWSFIDSTHFYYIGTPDSIAWDRPNPDVLRRTTDWGGTWQTIYDEYVGLEHGPIDLEFLDTLKGFKTRFQGVDRTTDGGRTWTDATEGLYFQPKERDELLSGLIWIDDRTVVAESSGGRILRWVEPSGAQADDRRQSPGRVRRDADGILVLENWPNLPIDEVSITDILGRTSYPQGDLMAGRFDCSDYPPGVYFVIVQSRQERSRVRVVFR